MGRRFRGTTQIAREMPRRFCPLTRETPPLFTAEAPGRPPAAPAWTAFQRTRGAAVLSVMRCLRVLPLSAVSIYVSSIGQIGRFVNTGREKIRRSGMGGRRSSNRQASRRTAQNPSAPPVHRRRVRESPPAGRLTGGGLQRRSVPDPSSHTRPAWAAVRRSRWKGIFCCHPQRW